MRHYVAHRRLRRLGYHINTKMPTRNIRTLCLSGLRGWTQVPLARAARVRIPQLSVQGQSTLLVCVCVRTGVLPDPRLNLEGNVELSPKLQPATVVRRLRTDC